MTAIPRLVSFAPMIDSETTRLLLDHYGIAYIEEPHAFLWGSALALRRAGSIQVPVLCGAGLSLVGPDAVLDFWDADQPPGRALRPPDPAMSAIARADWDQFHGTLAADTACLAYFHLLPRRDLLLEPFTRGIPEAERRLARLAYPVQRFVLSLGLRLSAANAAAAQARIRNLFDQTDRRVGDGRRYLQIDRLTAGDLALAAAAAPVTLPEGNRSPIPPLASLPTPYADFVAEMRSRPTAAFIGRLYRSLPLGGGQRASSAAGP